ncbi:MAG: hypothetical protein QOJ62_128 [Actinomycetota bacterium]|nr:hypothetical protein [Actinomycetota bacterium]
MREGFNRARARAGLTALVISAPLALVAATQPAAGATGPVVTRLAGTDRYATAAAIAQSGWPGALPAGSSLLLASGEKYPDAVAGAAAAGRLKVPMLLTAAAQLSGAASAEITRLKPATVVLLGGPAALSSAVQTQVAALGPAVVRWQGADRYGTAAATSTAMYPSGATNVYLASGAAFPDALAGGGLAAKAGGPLLLTDPAILPAATKAEIARLHPSAVVVLGGTASVSNAVAASAVAAAGGAQLSRISGADRFQTANAVAAAMVAVNGGTSASNGVLVANGLNFPDALGGAALAGATDRPLLLTPQSYVTPATWNTIQSLAPPTAFVLGGVNSISAAVAAGIAAGNPPTAPPPAPPAGSTDWLTYHKDAQRSGAATGTPAFRAFSSAWKAALDGAVYGEPIVVGSTVVAATEGGSLYGLSLGSGAVLWRTHIANPIPLSSLPCGNINPLGITGTPVYDPATGLVLAVGETAGGHHILAGVNLGTGALAFSRTLDPLRGDTLATQQRASLLLTNGRVYVAFGGLAGDCGNYIGQVVSVASDGSGTPIGWAVPTSREGGIWATPGPVALGDGTLLVSVGNGASNTTYDGSDSVTRLSASLGRLDWFAPSVWASDNSQDLDLGSMAPVIVGGRIFAAGKRGTAYLLDPAHLGGIGGQLAQMSFCAPFGGGSVAGNVAYIPCTDGVRAVAVSGNSMSVLWKAAGGAPGSPVYAAGTVYARDGGTSVVALDAANGGLRGSIAVGSMSRFASPSLSGNTLLIGTLSGVTAVHVS